MALLLETVHPFPSSFPVDLFPAVIRHLTTLVDLGEIRSTRLISREWRQAVDCSLKPVVLRLDTEADWTEWFGVFEGCSKVDILNDIAEKRYDQLGQITRLEIGCLPALSSVLDLDQLSHYSSALPFVCQKAMPRVDTVIIDHEIGFGSTCEVEIDATDTALVSIMRLISPRHVELDMSSLFDFYLDPTPASLNFSPFARYIEMTRRWNHPFDQVKRWRNHWPRLESVTWRHVPVKSSLCHSLPGISNRFIFALAIPSERNWGLSWGEAFAKFVSVDMFGDNTSWRLYGLGTHDIRLPAITTEEEYRETMKECADNNDDADGDRRMTKWEQHVIDCLRDLSWSEHKTKHFEATKRFRMYPDGRARRQSLKAPKCR